MKHPKILFILPQFSTGGTEGDLLRLISRWRPKDIQLAIACLRKQGPLLPDFERLGVPIVEFRTPHSVRGRAQRVIALARFMRAESVSIAENMMGMTSLYGALAAGLARVPVVISNQRNMGYAMGTAGRRMALRLQMQYLSSHVIVNAEAIKKWLVSNGYCSEQKVAVMYCGIPLDVSPGQTGDQRKRLGLSEGDLVIGCVARLDPIKGLDNLLTAIPGILRHCPRARFVIVGDGPERGKLERMRGELGIGHALIFAGYREDPGDIIACCDICVQPSLSEGLPTSILEYMRAGRPVVATAVGGIPEVVVDQQSGFLVRPDDQEALSDRLVRLTMNPASRAQMGERGREIVRSRFDIRRVVRDYDMLYHELILGIPSDFSHRSSARSG